MKNLVLKTVLILSVIASAGMAASGQDFKFRVLGATGQNTVKAEGEDSWLPLKIGRVLYDGDVVKVAEGGTVTLFGSNSRINLEPGETSIADVETGEQENSVAAKYLGHVLSKMSPEEVEANRKRYAEITGATERGLNDIEIFMKSSSLLYNKEAIVRWSGLPKGGTYVVTLQNLFDDVIATYETKETSYKIDLSNEMFKQHELVSVQISLKEDKGTTSPKYSIQKATDQDVRIYKEELSELMSVLDEDEPVTHLIMAEYYEQHGLLLDAMTCYEKALQLSNEQYFQDYYLQFLIRNGWTNSL